MEAPVRMKVSVVVPVFNKAPFLRECFESILSQSFADFELIVVDDQSTDTSMEVVASFRDDRIRTLRTERNVGPAGAAQRAMDVAQGEYIIRVDADDINMPDRFARQIAYMDRNPGLGASGGHLACFGTETGTWRFPVGTDKCRAEVLFGNPIAQPTAIMRASVLRKGGLRFGDDWPRIGEDWMLWARVLQHADMDNMDVPLVHYRRGEQNSTFGSRRSGYREVILHDVFRVFGIPLSDTQADLQLVGLRSFKEPPTRATVRSFREWLDLMREMNKARGLFQPAAFEKRLKDAWDQLFFALPPYGVGPALAHYRLSDVRDPARLTYLAKYTMNRWLGRLP
ncbi:MAG: glycosyltransferase family 2 protein [Flavobacteriales bacterium]|nr:glycosyltransferase family 2 protein [Flavobacteriales bacterium]